MERRFLKCESAPVSVETREDGGSRIAGYAAVFHRAGDAGTEYQLYEDVVERIAPTAFNRAISERHDVRALFNHSSDHILGRSLSGTLRLSVDERGLRYEVDMPDTQIGRDVAESIRRGDLTGSSFAFTPLKQSWQADRANNRDVRIIEDVMLHDVGPVTYPAYESTSAGIRSQGDDEALRARDEWRKRDVAVRMKLLTIAREFE